VPERFYVATDAEGAQHSDGLTTAWPLPVQVADGAFEPGATLSASAESPLVLFRLEGLLDELAERIFVAEPMDGVPSGSDAPSVPTGRGRLTSETSWTGRSAARFALDCSTHVLGDAASLCLPSGASLGDVVAAAGRWLDGPTDADGQLLGRISRITTARRLRRQGQEIGDLAFAITISDEGRDAEALDDPAFAALAAARDAVLAAVEAVRHSAFPHLSGADSAEPDHGTTLVDTPWGSLFVGHRSTPAWAAARDAAERARRAGANEDDERAWQAGRLASALGE
jgi:hypothetical protein